MANKNLTKAKINPNDEFYTQLPDIEKELFHYEKHFNGKTVLCNCDDPKVSNFFLYFVRNFKQLGLKRLITTCYKNCQPTLFSENKSESAVYLIYDGGDDNNPDVAQVATTAVPLKGDGDFRSKECIELLKQADIVVTNPPFSLFQEYIGQLVRYDKKFLIIGNQNALHYADVFPLIRDNKVWLGITMNGGNRWFGVPDSYPIIHGKIENGKKYAFPKGCVWFTNLEHKHRHDELEFFKKYNPDDYPTYDNYDGINVDKVGNIPMDYYGAMGVPDNFLFSYNPDQFEIIGIGSGVLAASIGVRKNYRGRTDIAYTKNGVSKCPYSRIIIKRRQNGKNED